MGKCETSTASMGIKIILSDLISQINEKNFDLIREMLEDGFIEDENELFNQAYSNIIHDEKITKNYINAKEYLTNEFKANGSYFCERFTHKMTPDISNGCLYDQMLLVPIKRILSSSRWGYDRYGTNGISRPINFDLSTNIEKYKEIDKFEIVFILKQNSG